MLTYSCMCVSGPQQDLPKVRVPVLLRHCNWKLQKIKQDHCQSVCPQSPSGMWPGPPNMNGNTFGCVSGLVIFSGRVTDGEANVNEKKKWNLNVSLEFRLTTRATAIHLNGGRIHNRIWLTVVSVWQGYVGKCIVMPINSAKLRTARGTKKAKAKFIFINSRDNNRDYPEVQIWLVGWILPMSYVFTRRPSCPMTLYWLLIVSFGPAMAREDKRDMHLSCPLYLVTACMREDSICWILP